MVDPVQKAVLDKIIDDLLLFIPPHNAFRYIIHVQFMDVPLLCLLSSALAVVEGGRRFEGGQGFGGVGDALLFS